MISLQPKQKERFNWTIQFVQNDLETNSSAKIFTKDILLVNNSLTKKYKIVSDVLVEIASMVKEFEPWYSKLFKSYVASGYNSEILMDNSDKCVKLVKKYLKAKNIDFSKFVDRTKATKTSVLFEEIDMESIALATTCLKIYSPFFYDIQMRPEENVQKKIYDTFISECSQNGTIDKIFELIRSIIFKSSVTDRYMWEMIKITVLETPETNVLSIFNFFMRNLLVLLNIEQNPAHFLYTIGRDSCRWALSDVYHEKIIYDDETVTSSEDVFGSAVSKETFSIYCCNDVLLKTANFGMTALQNDYGLTNDQFTSICEYLEKIKYMDPYLKLFNMTVISKVLNIPYKYLITSSPRHMVLTSLFINKVLPEEFFEKFPVLSEFLLCYTINFDSVIMKSSYKIRNIEHIFESDTPLFGINCRKLKYTLISPICGVLSANKKDLRSVTSGQSVSKMTYMDLEYDIIKYYESLYSGQLDDIFSKTAEKINSMF